jgi:hypothetical protein
MTNDLVSMRNGHPTNGYAFVSTTENYPTKRHAVVSMRNASPTTTRCLVIERRAFVTKSGVFGVAAAAAAVRAAPFGTRRKEAPVVCLAAVGTGAAFRRTPPRRGTRLRHAAEHPSAVAARPSNAFGWVGGLGGASALPPTKLASMAS